MLRVCTGLWPLPPLLFFRRQFLERHGTNSSKGESKNRTLNWTLQNRDGGFTFLLILQFFGRDVTEQRFTELRPFDCGRCHREITSDRLSQCLHLIVS